MSDPYRPSNYAPTYQPSSYVPHDTYASGALTTRPTSSDRYEDARPYYPSQSNLELSQNTAYRRTSDTYLSPTDEYPSHRHHKKSSRSHSRHRSDEKDRDGKSGRSRSHSRGKEWGATAVGGAAGAFIGNEIGHGPLGIGAGLLAGAIGAHELERRHEKHQEKRRLERDGGGARGDGDKAHRRRRSSGGLLDNVKDKVEGFLNPDGEKEKRRSRSSVGGGSSGGRRRGGYDSYSDSEEERYERKSGGGRRRDDY